jgi:hypothetical protein
MPTCSLHRGFQFQQVGIEMTQDAVFKRPTRLTQLLPVRHLTDYCGPFIANRVRGLVQVAP